MVALMLDGFPLLSFGDGAHTDESAALIASTFAHCPAATVVACYGLAFSGGFTNSLIAMDWNSYLQAEGADIEYPDATVPNSAYGNPRHPLPAGVVQPSLGKYIGFMALIYFIGMFAIFLCPLC